MVRSGYGIYYNGSVYGNLASQLAGQAPFTRNRFTRNQHRPPLTLLEWFPFDPVAAIPNTFAVEKNYHPGYAQSWTTSIQESFGRSWVISLAYNGTKGTDLDVLREPNRAPLGSGLNAQNLREIADASAFIYDSSIGNSSYNAAQVSLIRRFSRGSFVHHPLYLLEIAR